MGIAHAKTRSNSAEESAVIKAILFWYKKNGRAALPWRQTRDPYKVLVSELMLQQTQVSRVVPKYNAFIKRFSTIESLARADRTDVLRHWQGLGYNNRAVRLHTLTKLVVSEHDGKLPKNYDGLQKLPGIGPYTAGAVIIFAHDTPAPCIDVNIKRVLARISFEKNIAVEDIDGLALHLITASGAPHDWNSALMDFGSSICTARDPLCGTCPLRATCKSKGVRSDETDASKKQSKFAGSVRWYRGQVLKALLENKTLTREELQTIKSGDAQDRKKMVERDRKLNVALNGMEQEGMIIIEKKKDKGQRKEDINFVRLR